MTFEDILIAVLLVGVAAPLWTIVLHLEYPSNDKRNNRQEQRD